MSYKNLSNEIIKKKITGMLKICGNNMDSNFNFNYENENIEREELEYLCTRCSSMVKEIKDKEKANEQEKKQLLQAQNDREKEQKRIEKEKKERYIMDNSIHDPSDLVRLKFRFFNLSSPDKDDPNGENPLSAGPFFQDILSQFKHELNTHQYKLYAAVYNGDDMSGFEEYKQRNLNKCFASRMEEKDNATYFFACFRCQIIDEKCVYHSLWISNCHNDIRKMFPEFNFGEAPNADVFVDNFMSQGDNFGYIDEIYAR